MQRSVRYSDLTRPNWSKEWIEKENGIVRKDENSKNLRRNPIRSNCIQSDYSAKSGMEMKEGIVLWFDSDWVGPPRKFAHVASFLSRFAFTNQPWNEWGRKKGSKGVFDTKQLSFSTVKFTRDLANWLLTFYYSHLLEFLAEKICTTFSRKIFSKPREWTRSHFRDRWPSEEKIQRIVILHERGTICFFNEIRNS